MKFVIPLIFLITLSNCGKTKKGNITPITIGIASDTLMLDEGYNYYNFTNSDKYLAWYESILSELFIYNISTDVVTKTSVPSGKGPGEVTSVGDMIIIDEEIYILNKSQKKIVKYDIHNNEFKHVLVYKDDFRYMVNYRDTIYFRGAMVEGIYKSWTVNSESFQTIENSNAQDLMLMAKNNIFDFDGVTLINERYVLFAKYYKPEIVIYDKLNQKLETIEYDKVNNEATYEVNEFGFVSSPPQKVDLLLTDLDLIPETNMVVFMSKGSSKNRVYTNRLHIFDLDKRTFLDEIILDDNEYKYINIAGNDMFLFDNKNNVITKHKSIFVVN